MTVATLSEVLQPALRDGYAVAGLVVLGWEDARAFVTAAEAECLPVILQAGPACRAHTPLPIIATMFRHLAEQASVPVVLHLDHGYSREECQMALDLGFTSVMYDGSRKPLEDNIAETAAISETAHAAGASCEGEIGFVGYQDGAASKGTDPAEAAIFAEQTGVDAMAISIGNVHLQSSASSTLDETRLRDIQVLTGVPLVIHGGSGVPMDQRRALAKNSNICKFNIGTELRQTFGKALRSALGSDLNAFDRIEILKQTHDPVVTATRCILRNLKPD